MRSSSLFRRLALPLAAVALVAATRAFAASPPPPPFDTTQIGFINQVRIGTPACNTCPPRVCPGEPIPVTISGVLPSRCIRFLGFHDQPVNAIGTLLLANFTADTCGMACPPEKVPFSATVTLLPELQLSNGFTLRHQVFACADSISPIEVLEREYTYQVEQECPVRPPPVDSLVRSFVAFEITPARRCPGDSLSILMRTNGCRPCVHLSSFTHDPATGLQAVVDWRPGCLELGCAVESLTVALGAFAAGSHVLSVNVDVRVQDTPNPDSVISYVQPVPFEVPRTCHGAPCVEMQLPARDSGMPGCAVMIPPGGTGSVVMKARTGLEVWGAQGRIAVPFPFRILDVQYAGSAPRTIVDWNLVEGEVHFVAFTTGSQPIIPVGLHGFLRVTLGAGPSPGPDGTRADLSGTLDVAAGRTGDLLPPCPEPLDLRLPELIVCVGQRPDTCDANRDGRADVRDLVRMVACLRPDTSGTNTARVCIDCNQDGQFDLTDLFCCARHILRGPHVPRDSATVSEAVHVAFGELRLDSGRWIVPVRITGANGLAGTLVRMRYPSERWRADIPVYTQSGTSSNEGWMALADVGPPGVVTLGWLKLGEGEASELTLEFALSPIGEPHEHDILSVEGADLVLPDGSTLTPVGDLPAVSLIAPFEPPHVPSSLELSPPRPNPFTSTTTFSVSLPRESMVELTVHDVAGRVVATLARGRFAAGFRQFEWNGAGAREGVYFARLSVDGRVLSQRVALLRTGR